MSIDRSNTEANEHFQENQRRVETDSEKIIHRHLQNKDDVITDEDIRNIRVGVVEEPEITDEPEEKSSTDNLKTEKVNLPEKDITTPWDVLENKDE